jgi:hypothetical protein
MRRPLCQMLVDVIEAVSPEPASMVRVTSVTMDIPIAVEVRQTSAGLVFLADMPQWRWPTDFDPKRGRLKFECREGEVS